MRLTDTLAGVLEIIDMVESLAFLNASGSRPRLNWLRQTFLVLSARSEVFKSQLSCGMQESMTKEIAVEDCESAWRTARLRNPVRPRRSTLGSAHSVCAGNHAGSCKWTV